MPPFSQGKNVMKFSRYCSDKGGVSIVLAGTTVEAAKFAATIKDMIHSYEENEGKPAQWLYQIIADLEVAINHVDRNKVARVMNSLLLNQGEEYCRNYVNSALTIGELEDLMVNHGLTHSENNLLHKLMTQLLA